MASPDATSAAVVFLVKGRLRPGYRPAYCCQLRKLGAGKTGLQNQKLAARALLENCF